MIEVIDIYSKKWIFPEKNITGFFYDFVKQDDLVIIQIRNIKVQTTRNDLFNVMPKLEAV